MNLILALYCITADCENWELTRITAQFSCIGTTITACLTAKETWQLSPFDKIIAVHELEIVLQGQRLWLRNSKIWLNLPIEPSVGLFLRHVKNANITDPIFALARYPLATGVWGLKVRLRGIRLCFSSVDFRSLLVK